MPCHRDGLQPQCRLTVASTVGAKIQKNVKCINSWAD
jgi:hypothetical protein